MAQGDERGTCTEKLLWRDKKFLSLDRITFLCGLEGRNRRGECVERKQEKNFYCTSMLSHGSVITKFNGHEMLKILMGRGGTGVESFERKRGTEKKERKRAGRKKGSTKPRKFVIFETNETTFLRSKIISGAEEVVFFGTQRTLIVLFGPEKGPIFGT